MNAVLEPREVAQGVSMLSLRTPTLPPATHTNAYLIGSREFVLIEPASPYEPEIAQAVAWVEAELRAGRELRAIVLTHHHPDHVGGAAALRRHFAAPIWAHPRTAERLTGSLTIDRLLEDGERLELDGSAPLVLECVHTPGHAPGHLCFFERASGALVAGDMVAGVGTILVETQDGDMQQYLASLARMRALGPTSLLPAHGLPISAPDERLAFYIAHRLGREAKIVAALATFAQGALLDELVPEAYADTPKVAWPLARLSLEAHLVKLQREGRADRQGARWCSSGPA